MKNEEFLSGFATLAATCDIATLVACGVIGHPRGMPLHLFASLAV